MMMMMNYWIVIFKGNEVLLTDSMALNGALSGEFVYSGTLGTGSYYLTLFMNGTAHEISNRVYFSVDSRKVVLN